MLTVSVNEHFDPYELARHMIKMPETGDGTLRDIKVDIESGRVTFSDGNPSNSILNLIGIRQIKSVSNTKPSDIKISAVGPDKLVGVPTAVKKTTTEIYPKADTKSLKSPDRRFVTSRNEIVDNRHFYKDWQKPKRMSLWMVDFGVPVGGEFGYPHPAILCEETSKGLWNVIPCSTKYRDGKEVLELSFLDPKVLKNKSPKFYAHQTTNVLFKERQSVSEKRFIQYLGDISEEYYAVIERCCARGSTEVNVNFTLEDLKLGPKQLNLLCGKEKEAVEIGNSELTYEEKVKKLMNLLGFYPDADEASTYLFEAIKKTRFLTNIDSKQLFVDISRGKLMKPDTVQGMVTVLLKKKYKELYPCFEAFLRLINLIAYYH